MKTKSVKQAEAITRNDSWSKLSYLQQLEYLDRNGFDAKKQRTKILTKIILDKK